MIRDLNSESDIHDIFELSRSKPVLILKHSTRCGISARAYQEFRNHLNDHREDDLAVYTRVLVVEQRDLSHRLGELLGVPHQSPQLIVVRNGKAVRHMSHFAISSESIQDALRETEKTNAT